MGSVEPKPIMVVWGSGESPYSGGEAVAAPDNFIWGRGGGRSGKQFADIVYR